MSRYLVLTVGMGLTALACTSCFPIDDDRTVSMVVDLPLQSESQASGGFATDAIYAGQFGGSQTEASLYPLLTSADPPVLGRLYTITNESSFELILIAPDGSTWTLGKQGSGQDTLDLRQVRAIYGSDLPDLPVNIVVKVSVLGGGVSTVGLNVSALGGGVSTVGPGEGPGSQLPPTIPVRVFYRPQ
jgi:hypothetical protein